MRYPKWTPPSLVEYHKRQENAVASDVQFLAAERDRLATMTEEEWTIENPIWSKVAYLRQLEGLNEQEKAKTEYFKRLATDPTAQEIWSSLERHLCQENPFARHSDDPMLGYALVCWEIRWLARNRPFHTPREKSEHLANIVGAAQKLASLLRNSPYFDNRWFIAEKLTGEAIPPDYYPSRYARALEDWRVERRRRSVGPASEPRDSHWLLSLYHQLTLEKVIQWVETDAETQKSQAPIVSHTKGPKADRNYFVRTLHERHLCAFGTPLPAVISAVTAIALNLPEELAFGPEDVGKIMPLKPKKQSGQQ